MDYRPVNAKSPILSLVNHAYIDVSETIAGSTFEKVIEGLPAYNPPKLIGGFGVLVPHVYDVSSEGEVADDPQDHPRGDQSTRSPIVGGANICADIGNLIRHVPVFRRTLYNPISSFGGPLGANSNFFAWWELNAVGLDLGAPPNAPGFPGSNLFQ